jgi:hypothetical protein
MRGRRASHKRLGMAIREIATPNGLETAVERTGPEPRESAAITDLLTRKDDWIEREVLLGELNGRIENDNQPDAAADGPAEAKARLLDDEQLEAVGKEMVDVIHPEVWRRSDISKRMVMAQRAHAFIRQAYGLKDSFLVYDLNLPPRVAGRFDSTRTQISLNASLLEDDHPGELVDTLAHENRHEVQVQLVAEMRKAAEPGDEGGRSDVDWAIVDELSGAWKRYDTNDAPAYYANKLEVDARRSGLQLAGNGYWRAYMDQLAVQ